MDEPTGKFSDLFNEGDFKTNAEKYEKDLSSISTALEKYRTEGQLTSEEQKNLMADLQMGNIDKTSLSKKGLGILSDYISSIRTEMEDMSEPQKMQAQKYIESIAETYMSAYDDISSNDISKVLNKSLGIKEEIVPKERQ